MIRYVAKEIELLTFQCSPTSRVGVNANKKKGKDDDDDVSVLSDEPCWGQS